MTDQNNILDWIDDKGYQEGSLDSPEALASREIWRKLLEGDGLNHLATIPSSITCDKMSDGCCHKTVLEHCADCPFKEK